MINVPKIDIGNVGNVYGGLVVMRIGDSFYWIIEGVGNDLDNLDDWEEIDEELYNLLIKHNNKIKND
jgi:hypothetical protein